MTAGTESTPIFTQLLTERGDSAEVLPEEVLPAPQGGAGEQEGSARNS